MDIQKIKLGTNTYDIKDFISRTGFATASLVHNITDSSVNNGNSQFSGIVFYADSAKTIELGKVKFTQLAVPVLAADYVGANFVSANLYGLENTDAGIIDSTSISVKKVNNKPVISFNSSTTGALAGETSGATATEVQLPVGQSGTIALVSDITSASDNKVGYGNKALEVIDEDNAVDSLNFYKDSQSSTPLFVIPLNTITTQEVTTQELFTNGINFNTPSQWNLDSDYVGVAPDVRNGHKYFTFTMGNGSSNPSVSIPMDTNGTVALISDVNTSVSAVQDQIDDINEALGLTGEDATATIDTYNEVKDFLEGLATSPDLASTLTTMQTDINSRLTASDIVDNLTSTATNKALSANQGKVLDGKITTLSNAVVKKISLNGEEISPSSGTVTLPNTVTKIQLNGKDQTLDTSGTGSVGKVNLNGIVTKVNFNGTDVSPVTDSTTGAGVVTIAESDPVFTAHVAHSITPQDISNWNTGASGVTDVKYTTTGSGQATDHLKKKKKGTGNYVSFVQLPTARYINTASEPETLELVLAASVTT